jgi:phosphoribosylaminoimidazolecarboxamide formyltransferase/IMP cyclohydrolase
MRKIKRALISVSDKTGIVEFAKFLRSQDVEIISTGGTAKKLREEGVTVRDISNLTGFPEIMDGRVKTLHPKVHGALLAVRDNKEHQKAIDQHGIREIDLVVVNLYPFEETVKKGAEFDEIIENIDIGGPSMIRSSAKNHKYVTVIVNPERYEGVMEVMKKNNGHTTEEIRKALAAEAFSRTSVYDSAISSWFESELKIHFPEKISVAANRKSVLRYGENPHQQASLYVSDDQVTSACNALQIQGKELSYNNIMDADSAYELVQEFDSPASVIVKHNNPCGVAVADSLSDAFKSALNCDPVSAFGGIFAFNKELDVATAEQISEIFAEVVIAPSFSELAKEVLSKKKNLRLLETGKAEHQPKNSLNIKSITGGFLIQEKDSIIFDEEDLKIVTKRKPTKQEMNDLLFAFTVCKHVKSNAIIYAKDGATVGVGAGQMSRVDSSRIGAWKAKETNKNSNSAKGAVLASDAFFPFADGLEAAAEHGVTAVIQPGGSIRDDEVIKAADKANIAMVFTGIRHFRH